MRVEWARYPFTEEAKRGFEKLQENSISEDILKTAADRVISGIKYKNIPRIAHISDKDIKNDIKSYILARIMISILGRKIDNYIEGEVMRALSYAQHYHQENHIFNQLGIKIAENRILLRDYLRLVAPYSKMKLTNRIVKDGWVEITRPERTVILKEAIKSEVSKGLPISNNLIPENIKSRVEPYIKYITDEIIVDMPNLGNQSKDIAPCIEQIINELRNGEKVSHIKRWVMAVFLVNRGWDTDRIVNIFANQPNFNERVTKYQIQHIKSKKYSMPSCATLKTQGVCIRNCKIKNPLQYRKSDQTS